MHPSMSQWWRPVEVLRRQTILNAACVDTEAASIDRAYVERLLSLTADFPAGARWLLFAFDNAHDDAPLPLSIDAKALPERVRRLAPIFASHVLRHDRHRAPV